MTPSPHDECFRTEDFRRLEGLVLSVFAKMDSFLADMRQIAVGDARHQEQMLTLRRDVDHLFKRVRDISTEIQGFRTFKDELRGSIKVWVGVPSVLAAVLALLHIYKLLKGV